MSNSQLKIDFRNPKLLFAITDKIWATSDEALNAQLVPFKKNLDCIKEMVELFPIKLMTFGEFLKCSRRFLSVKLKKKVTQKVLADFSLLSLSRVTFLEGDHPSNLYVEEILKLEKSLNIPILLIITLFGRLHNVDCENDEVFDEKAPTDAVL